MQENARKRSYKQKAVRFYEQDGALLQHTEGVEDFTKYVKELIREDMERKTKVEDEQLQLLQQQFIGKTYSLKKLNKQWKELLKDERDVESLFSYDVADMKTISGFTWGDFLVGWEAVGVVEYTEKQMKKEKVTITTVVRESTAPESLKLKYRIEWKKTDV